MTIGSAHAYISGGIAKGGVEDLLEKVVSDSREILSNNLPPIYDLKHITHYTGVGYSYLRAVISRKHSPYNPYSIPKRSGGMRFIHAPEGGIKRVQRWISSEILSDLIPHWRCFSFHKHSSIKQCAAEHSLSRWLIKIDIERFFESVSEIQVYKLFRKLGYKPLVSFELARICSISPSHIIGNHSKRWVLYNKGKGELPYKRETVKYIGRLPQGAPTSPQISNLIFYDIDDVFQKIAEENGLVYTRYADDITFSSSKRKFCRDDALSIVSQVNSVLIKNGYNPQHKKLKIIPPGSKKIVLGLEVSENEPRLQKSYVDKIETHLRGMDVFGITQHASHRKFRSAIGMLDHVRGLINYASFIEPKRGGKMLKYFIRLTEEAGLEL
jgi:RNA-directed DNA polymerase